MDDEIRGQLRKIKAVALDGDGVLFTGRVFMHHKDGEVLKERSHIDGQGISFLRAAGIRIAFVSGEATGFVEAVGKKLNDLPSVVSGKWPPVGIFVGGQGKDKVAAVGGWLKEINIPWEACAAMGDDISDYLLLGQVGFAAVPRSAEAFIKKRAHWVAPRKGGDGAIRDLANLILEAQDIDIHKLAMR